MPIKERLQKQQISNNRKQQIYELLDYLKDLKTITLTKAKDNNWVTALCWLQYNSYIQIIEIREVNNKNEITYKLSVDENEIPNWPN